LKNFGRQQKKFDIVEFVSGDYDEAFKLWKEEEYISISNADERSEICNYLKHNKGLSFIAKQNDKVVGSILCGTDWRRGYINHFVVKKKYRRQGIGAALLEKSLEGLKALNVSRCYLFVFNHNDGGILYWQKKSFVKRDDMLVMSIHEF